MNPLVTIYHVWQGNLGWAYLLQSNYVAAEVVYRKAQMIEPDANKACNLGLCLIRQGRFKEARHVLEDVIQSRFSGSDDCKIVNKAQELIREIPLQPATPTSTSTSTSETNNFDVEDEILQRIDLMLDHWAPARSRRLPIFEEISSFRDQITCWWSVLILLFVRKFSNHLLSGV